MRTIMNSQVECFYQPDSLYNRRTFDRYNRDENIGYKGIAVENEENSERNIQIRLNLRSFV